MRGLKIQCMKLMQTCDALQPQRLVGHLLIIGFDVVSIICVTVENGKSSWLETIFFSDFNLRLSRPTNSSLKNGFVDSLSTKG